MKTSGLDARLRPTTVVSRPSRLLVQAAVKKSKGRNVLCNKTLKVKKERLEEASKLCKSIGTLAKEAMQDKNNGILDFEVFVDPCNEQLIHFWERYIDNIQMGRFNTSEKYQAFMKDIQHCLDEPVGLALYSYTEDGIGSLSVQGGPKGEGGLDDATGAGGRGASGYKQTSDVVNLGDVKRGDEGDSFGMPGQKFNFPKFKLPWDD